MILVLLGTNPYPFRRLLGAVDTWARRKQEVVIAQSGHTPTDGLSIECHAFVPHDEITRWIRDAEIVICQGGMGSLQDCLAAGRPTIAVPRRPDYGESQDQQSELVDALASMGRVIPLHHVENLDEAIERARKMQLPTVERSSIPMIVAEAVRESILQ